MSVVVFVLLATLAAVAIAYPLLKPGMAAEPQTRISDAQIRSAVQRVRQARHEGSLPAGDSGRTCPTCSAPYEAGDRFCVRCGQTLPQQETAVTLPQGRVCPSCGAALRGDDVFCSRCGHRLPASVEGSGLEEVES